MPQMWVLRKFTWEGMLIPAGLLGYRHLSQVFCFQVWHIAHGSIAAAITTAMGSGFQHQAGAASGPPLS